MRVDANISVAKADSTQHGVRCEVKNVSGLRFLQRAVGNWHGSVLHDLTM